MKASEVPAALREFAERFEALGLDDDSVNFGLGFDAHHVNGREALAKLVSLIVNPHLEASVPAIVGYDWKQNPVRIALFYEPGLLGGERKEVVVDSKAGLEALIAECEPRDPAEFDNAAEQAELAIHHGN